MPDDFPITRRTIDRLDEWVGALAAPILPLKKVPAPPPHVGFMWEAPEKTERALIVGKAVRMASGIRTAMVLADLGYVTECGVILRTVADFATEVVAICEGCRSGNPTKAQRQFLQDYFAPMPATAEEHDKEKGKRFVARGELLKSHQRLAMEAKQDVNRVRQVFNFLAYALDKMVHGSWMSTQELYNKGTRTFMLRGHSSEENRCGFKAFVASKLHEVLAALAFAAAVDHMPALHDSIKAAAKELHKSGELVGDQISN